MDELDDAFVPQRKRPRAEITASPTSPPLLTLVREAIEGAPSDMSDLAMAAVGDFDDEAHDEAHALGSRLQEALLTLRLFRVERDLMRHKKCVLDRHQLIQRHAEEVPGPTTVAPCAAQRTPFMTLFSFLTGVLIATMYPFSLYELS